VAHVYLVCSSIQCDAVQRRPEDMDKVSYKGFNTDGRSRSFINLYLQVLENVFPFYSKSLQSVFQWVFICGGECHYFYSAIIFLAHKGSC